MTRSPLKKQKVDAGQYIPARTGYSYSCRRERKKYANTLTDNLP
jgi:hypothetical protein